MKKILIFILVLLVLFGLLKPVNGANPTWTKPTGINGGEIDKVVLSPNFSNDSTLFAGSTSSFYYSNNGGASFTNIPINVGFNLTLEGVLDFTLSKDFSKDSTVYIATKNGVFKTSDFGKSFSPYQMGIDATYVTLITADPVTNTLLACGVSFEKRDDGKVLNTNLIMKNDTSTKTWKTIAKFTSDYVTAIASYNDNYYVGTEYGELFKINDTKTQLFKANSPITSISCTKDVVALSTLGDGIYLTKDFKTFNNELPGTKIIAVKVTDSSNLYALKRTGTLYVKKNGNYSEYQIPYPSTNLNFDANEKYVFIASYEYGIIKFDLETKTFALANKGIANVNTTTMAFSPKYDTSKTIYLGTANNGLYVSKDGGKTFASTGNLDSHQILSICELSNGTILVGTLGEGIFASTDGGITFNKKDVFKNDSIGVIYEYNGNIFIGTKNRGLWVTDLTLQSPKHIDSLPPYDVNINFIKGAGQYLFVATNGGNLYRSDDYGKTFKEIGNNKFWGLSITGFDISKTFLQDGLVLVGTAGGEFISYDRGNTFMSVYDLGTTWADGVAISPNYTQDGFMVVGAWGASGTTYGNIYITKNKGLSYENIGSGMTNRYVVNVFLTPDFYYGKSGSLITLTSSGGLFRYSFETTVEVILTVGKNEVIVNGEKKTIEAPPYIKNGRTMVPVRVISEAFGADVGWNDKTKEVTIRYKDKNIILKIGSPYALVNGTQTPIDRDNLKVVPEITNGRTFVPIRFISETFGAKVEWNDVTQQIRITLGG